MTFSLPHVHPLGHACKTRQRNRAQCRSVFIERLRCKSTKTSNLWWTWSFYTSPGTKFVALAYTIMRRKRGTDKCFSRGLASGGVNPPECSYGLLYCSRRRTGWRSLKREVFARCSRATCRSVTNFRATAVCVQITGLRHRSASRRTSLTGQNTRIPHKSIRPPKDLYASL